jgi:hypothetical protein
MEQNKDNFGFGENIPDLDKTRELNEIEDDSDKLEPFIDDSEHREINADDQADLSYWAQQFQISEEELKSAIALNGTCIRDIKKYLSI